MDARWISQDDFGKNVESVQAILVVVPEGEEKIVERMLKIFDDVNREMANEGYDFSLDASGSEGSGSVPVLFIREADYLPAGEMPTGLISLVPMGLAGKVHAATKRGAESLNRDAIKWMAWMLWQAKNGNTDALEAAREELGA